MRRAISLSDLRLLANFSRSLPVCPASPLIDSSRNISLADEFDDLTFQHSYSVNTCRLTLYAINTADFFRRFGSFVVYVNAILVFSWLRCHFMSHDFYIR